MKTCLRSFSIEHFKRGWKSKKQLRDCYGICNAKRVWVKCKKVKNWKNERLRPVFVIYGGLLLIVREGCGIIREYKSIVLIARVDYDGI